MYLLILLIFALTLNIFLYNFFICILTNRIDIITADQDQKLWDFADQAKILDSLNRKKGIFLTPLNCALNALILALKDSAEALVLRLSK